MQRSGVLFSPWLFGERCPVTDPTVRASFTNMSLATTRGHLVRAVLEGVAFNTRWLLGAVEKFVGRRLDRIRIIGGGARSELWCRILADVLDRDIAQVEDPVGANARGAALVALAAAQMKHSSAPSGDESDLMYCMRHGACRCVVMGGCGS